MKQNLFFVLMLISTTLSGCGRDASGTELFEVESVAYEQGIWKRCVGRPFWYDVESEIRDWDSYGGPDRLNKQGKKDMRAAYARGLTRSMEVECSQWLIENAADIESYQRMGIEDRRDSLLRKKSRQ